MNEVAYGTALALAVVFAWAGVAKLRRPRRTRRAFRALGVGAPLARVVPVVELVLAVTLVVAPRVGGAAAAVLLAAFTVVLARADDGVGCACFGGSWTAPVTSLSIARNAALLGAAIVAVTATPVMPGVAAVAVVAGLASLTALALAVADLGHRTGAVLRVDLP